MRTSGVVTAIATGGTKGVWIQDATGDNNIATSDATSDAVFVASASTVKIGDLPEVQGMVALMDTMQANETDFLWESLFGFESTAGAIGRVVFADVGYMVLDDLTFQSAAATVPEPGSLALLGLGLAGFAAARRKPARKYAGAACPRRHRCSQSRGFVLGFFSFRGGDRRATLRPRSNLR